jgi:hypothetical protein
VRYTGPVRFIGVTPENEATVIQFGRNMLGDVMEQVRLGGLFQHQMTRVYDDIVLTARFDGTIASLSATTRQTQSAATLDTASRLWLPRGFVVYPSSSGSSTGWGTPVVSLHVGDTPFTSTNVTPGLSTDRWTAGGKLGEVLISRQLAAGYPKQPFEITPAFYSVGESPALIINADGIALGTSFVVKPPATGPWAAYRLAFDDYAHAGGEGGIARQSLFTAVVAAAQFLPPLRGYYDAAARAVRYVLNSDFPSGATYINDHDLSDAQHGYTTAAQRQNKDGAAALAHETISTLNDDTLASTLRTQCHLADSTFDAARTSLSLGIRNGITAIDAIERDQWIAYGNRQWIGDDPALPVVSWDGFPSWNWPSYLVLGTLNAGVWVDLDFYKVTLRGVDAQLFSKRVCANGRTLGLLPDYVLSAGVQTRVESDATIDRLVVICFRLSDQPAWGPISFEPYMKTLRVYFVDIPRRNNVVLLPDHAVIGLYDATTNPDGWHAAGTFDPYPAGFTGAGSYHSLSQPPQFKGDGSRAVWIGAAYDDGTTIHVGAFAIEGVFNSITDGVTSVSMSLVDLATRSEHGIVFSASGYCYGIDYLPNSATVRFFYSCGLTYEDHETTDQALRWSVVADKTGLSVPSDVKANTGLIDGFAFSAAWTLDPLRGAMVGLQQKVSGGHGVAWRQLYASNGAAVVSTDIADGLGTVAWQNDVSTFANWAAIGVSVHAKIGSNYIAGFELAPNGTLLNAFFDSSLGDIAALTQTPGTGLRLYPVGAV